MFVSRPNHYDICLAGDTFSGVAQVRKRSPDLILLDLGLLAGGGFLVMERLKMIP
jgi:DNA-binding response OmpR family regulator